MINAFNYLTLRELFLIRIRHFDHLDTVQKFKVMWAIDRAKKIMDKARERKSNLKDKENQQSENLFDDIDDKATLGEIINAIAKECRYLSRNKENDI